MPLLLLLDELGHCHFHFLLMLLLNLSEELEFSCLLGFGLSFSFSHFLSCDFIHITWVFVRQSSIIRDNMPQRTLKRGVRCLLANDLPRHHFLWNDACDD